MFGIVVKGAVKAVPSLMKWATKNWKWLAGGIAKGAKVAPAAAKAAPAATEKAGMLAWATKNWKPLAGVTVVGHAHLNDQSVIKSTVDLGGKLLNIQKLEDETMIAAGGREVVDAFTKKGTFDKTVNKAEEVVQDMTDAGHQIVNTTRQMTSGGGLMDFISNMFSGLTNGASNFLGGGSSGLNFGALAMLPLAWFAFGKFGWLGKVGALAMLMYGLSNMFKTQEQPRQVAVQPVRSTGEGRELPSAKESYDAIERQEAARSASDEEQYTVRAKV